MDIKSAFGVVGDNVADDTAALNTAFAYGSNNKVPIYIPPGRYKITSPLFAASCDLVGTGS